jgi:hypothetical protein
MGAAMKADKYFFICQLNIGGHIDQISKDLSRLGVGIASHALPEK